MKMRFQAVTWKFWALVIMACCAYAAAGYSLSSNGKAEMWIYRVGLTASPAIVLGFVGRYTWAGIRGIGPASKWWRTPISSAMMISALAVIPVAAPLAYVFWFNNGILKSSWLAWLEVSGPCITALSWLWVARLWNRARRAAEEVKK